MPPTVIYSNLPAVIVDFVYWQYKFLEHFTSKQYPLVEDLLNLTWLFELYYYYIKRKLGVYKTKT